MSQAAIIDISTPDGQKSVRKLLNSITAAEALRSLEDNYKDSPGGWPSRTAEMSMEDKEKRLVRMSFSSESPVERWFGTEILSHERGAPDLDWLNSGRAPMLWMHNGREQIGVVVSASHDVAAKRCNAVCRIAKDAEGDKYLARVDDGIIKNVSFAYRINEWTRTESSDDEGMPTYTATKWRGVEISLVSTPADETVGVGRSAVTSFRTPDTKTVSTPILPTRTTMTEQEIAAEAEKTRKAQIAAERKRINTLNALRKRYDPAGERVTDVEFARFSDDETKGELEFRQYLETLNVTEERVAPVITETTKVRTGEDKLPLLHALRGLVFGGKHVLERFTKEDAELRAASPMCFKPGAQGERQLVVNANFVRASHFLPTSITAERAQNAQGFAAGGALVGTTFAPEIIEYLRPEPNMVKAGSIVLSGITGGPGTIRFPKQTGDIYGQWAAAGIGSTPQQLPFGALDLTPKRLIAQIRIDKQLLLQESFDVEAYIRNSVNLQFALAYDLAGLIGSGNGMPLGILNTPNIQKGAVTFNGPSAASGLLAPQYANFLSFRQLVLAANAGGLGKRTFITSPQSLINWAGVPKATPAATQTVNDKWMLEFGQGGMEYSVLGERALETTYLNTLPAAYTAAGFNLAVADVAIYGPFNQYMFLEWAGVEWIYDPYTQAAEDVIVLTARLYVDGGCRQPTAFVTSSNAGSVQYV